MAVRTTPELVGKVIELDDTIDLVPFISVASGLVDQFCASSGYAPSWLVEIETWLAAHFYAIRDPRETNSGIGPLTSQFETNKVDYGLRLTRYGQQTLIFDYKGGLAALDNGLKITAANPRGGTRVMWLGGGGDCRV